MNRTDAIEILKEVALLDDSMYAYNKAYMEALETVIDAIEHTAPPAPHRITIRDIVDLLDYDRTGIRTLRIVDEDTKQSDMLRTDSYLMQYIEDTAVNTLDTVNGVITLYVDYGGRKDE